MADKLLPCICGGNGITVDADPPQREVEWCEKHGCEPRRHYAVRCDKGVDGRDNKEKSKKNKPSEDGKRKCTRQV